MKKKYYDGFNVIDILFKNLEPKKMLEVLTAFAETKGVDAVEVIRCKDCKYAKPWKGIDRDWIDCTADNKRLMKPEGFCSWAERKEHENN